MTELTWNERINAISINPDMATRDDIARLASELSETNSVNTSGVLDPLINTKEYYKAGIEIEKEENEYLRKELARLEAENSEMKKSVLDGVDTDVFGNTVVWHSSKEQQEDFELLTAENERLTTENNRLTESLESAMTQLDMVGKAYKELKEQNDERN